MAAAARGLAVYFFFGTISTAHSSAASVRLGLRNPCVVSAFSSQKVPACSTRWALARPLVSAHRV